MPPMKPKQPMAKKPMAKKPVAKKPVVKAAVRKAAPKKAVPVSRKVSVTPKTAIASSKKISKDESDKDKRLQKWDNWRWSVGDIEAEGGLDDPATFNYLVNQAAVRGLRSGAFKDISTGRKEAKRILKSITF